jgi:hypothetical protein
MLKRVVNSVRRNHALEHATIAVLLAKLGQMRVIGRATADGFYIYANVPTSRLGEFAEEALDRLKRGESHLAVSPLCGTNLVVAGMLAGIGSYLALDSGRNRLGGLPGAITAAMIGVLAAQPLGRLVQKHYTTSPDLAGVSIVSIERIGRGSTLHKIRTAASVA